MSYKFETGAPDMKAKEIVIKGRVHDVGYRLFLLSEAERLFIEKFDARNVLVDGEQHLIVLVEGAEEKISRFVEFAESNYPPEASVDSVEVRSIDSFRQSLMVFQLAKIAQAGVGMLGKQDAMLEKQDLMVEKQDETIEVIKEEGGKTREVLKGKIEEDVEWLKEEINGIKVTLGKVKEKVGID
jgi:acylphosphatase